MSKSLTLKFDRTTPYCDHDIKVESHKEAKKVLRLLAKELGIHSSEYDLRSNMGGMAVSGEITLHTEDIYIQISNTRSLTCDILYRTVEDRRDYVGHQNNLARIDKLENLGEFAQTINNLIKRKIK